MNLLFQGQGADHGDQQAEERISHMSGNFVHGDSRLQKQEGSVLKFDGDGIGHAVHGQLIVVLGLAHKEVDVVLVDERPGSR